MPLKKYGVLAGKAVAARREDNDETPHYQIEIEAAGTHYRIAVNVKSNAEPSELLYLVDESFEHPIVERLPGLADGFTRLPPQPGAMALDFIRGNLFDRSRMRLLPHHLPGPDNDLADRIEHFVRRALNEPGVRVYAFGERWGPEPGTRDKVFGFLPGNGIHDIHMNQGNIPQYRDDDGVWQDGGFILHFPASNQWVAVFLAFQSQAWHTDDQTGHALTVLEEPEKTVRVIAALVNPSGGDPELEAVLLLNPMPQDVDLAGWQIADQQKRKCAAAGLLPAGTVLRVDLAAPTKLGNSGGIVTLLNAEGLKVDGVSYTKSQAAREGWWVVF